MSTNCKNCDIARAIAVINAAVSPTGTPVPVPTDNATIGDVYDMVTVINDTDRDVQVEYKTTKGILVQFIVPKSIRAYTKRTVAPIVNSTVKVMSTSNVTLATGNIIFNFSN
jgi:hypothetical protein